jgi:hypothetical protein
MDIFFLQLAIIFLPGIIWERIDTQYGLKRPPAQFDILRRSFVFGLILYTLTYGLYLIIGRPFDYVEPKKDSTFLAASFFDEIAVASFLSLITSTLWLYISRFKVLTRFMQKIKATKRFGDEDVWDFTFNSDSANVEYVHLRDFDKEIVYSGWVEAFSETDKIRELVLRDVKVFNFEGVELFDTPRVYIARPMDNIDIEFPHRA